MTYRPSWAETPSKFTREDADEWRRWNANDKGTTPHQDIGSRSRPMSIAYSGASTDELYEQMVKRGLVAATPEKKPKRKRS